MCVQFQCNKTCVCFEMNVLIEMKMRNDRSIDRTKQNERERERNADAEGCVRRGKQKIINRTEESRMLFDWRNRVTVSLPLISLVFI
jgi:hypothetical protein